jgi:hypothetical protein
MRRARRAWSEDEIFYGGDVVTCDGGTWQARKDTSKKPPHRDWLPLAVAGRNAAFPVVRGTFDPAQSYAALSIVALNGSAFISRCDDPGECPGDGWQLRERGERGLPGQAAPTILSWQIDPDRYRATPLMSDGREGPALELRPLF